MVDWITDEQAAEMICRSPATIANWRRLGKKKPNGDLDFLPYLKGRPVMIRLSAFMDFLDRHEETKWLTPELSTQSSDETELETGKLPIQSKPARPAEHIREQSRRARLATTRRRQSSMNGSYLNRF